MWCGLSIAPVQLQSHLYYMCAAWRVRVLHCLDKDTLSVSDVRELLFPVSLSSSHLHQIGWDERCGTQTHWHSLKY